MNTLRYKRIVAFGIDLLLFLPLLWSVLFIIHNIDKDGFIGFWIAFVIWWFMCTILESFTGQTIGKLIMRLKLISTRFYKFNLVIALPRNILKIIIFPISAIAYLFSNREGVALHDKVVGAELIQI